MRKALAVAIASFATLVIPEPTTTGTQLPVLAWGGINPRASLWSIAHLRVADRLLSASFNWRRFALPTLFDRGLLWVRLLILVFGGGGGHGGLLSGLR